MNIMLAWTVLLAGCLSPAQSLTNQFSLSETQVRLRASIHNIKGCHTESGLLLCQGLPNLGDGFCDASDLDRIVAKIGKTNEWRGEKSLLIRTETSFPWRAAPLPQFDTNHLGAPSAQWQMLHSKGVFMLDDFLSDSEADAIALEMHKDSAISSEVVAPAIPYCSFRRSTSWVFYGFQRERKPFPNDFIKRMEKTTGVPKEHYEPTQVVEYTPGDFFSDHYDTSPCDHIGDKNLPELKDVKLLRHISCDEKTRRQATLIVYLTGESEGQGGATYFPKLDVRVKPKKGRALFFRPTRADGSNDPWMLHSAETLSSGKKLLLQQWIMHGTER